jgi:hypothetical protein
MLIMENAIRLIILLLYVIIMYLQLVCFYSQRVRVNRTNIVAHQVSAHKKIEE